MTTDTDRIKRKAEALLAIAGDPGSSEAEATSAAAIADRLIREHCLDMSSAVADTVGSSSIKTGGALWRALLAQLTGVHVGVYVLRQGSGGRAVSMGWGTETERALWSYLYEVSERYIMAASRRYQARTGAGRGVMNDYRKSAVMGFASTLRAMRADVKGGTALVLASRNKTAALATCGRVVGSGMSYRANAAGRTAGAALTVNPGVSEAADQGPRRLGS